MAIKDVEIKTTILRYLSINTPVKKFPRIPAAPKTNNITDIKLPEMKGEACRYGSIKVNAQKYAATVINAAK